MKVEQTTLANGLRIVTAHMADFPSAAAFITVGTGSRNELASNNGVSHMLEHLLLKGTEKYPTPQCVSDAIESVGGEFNAFTYNDITAYYAKVLGRYLPRALDVLAEMVARPLLHPDTVDHERLAILEEKHMGEDDPDSVALDIMSEQLFPGHALGRSIIGPEEVIKGLPLKAIRAYHRRRYCASQMVVAVAGQVDHGAVVRQMEQSLGWLTSGGPARATPLSMRLSDGLVAAKVYPTQQSHLLVSGRFAGFDNPSRLAGVVLSTILGVGASSRLYDKIRVQQGLAYGVDCGCESLIDTGWLAISAGVALGKSVRALESVAIELDRVRQEPVTPAELNRAKRMMTTALEMSSEDNILIADTMAYQLAVTGKLVSIDKRIARVEAVTAADVQAAAQELLAPEKLRLAIVAPENEVKAATDYFCGAVDLAA